MKKLIVALVSAAVLLSIPNSFAQNHVFSPACSKAADEISVEYEKVRPELPNSDIKVHIKNKGTQHLIANYYHSNGKPLYPTKELNDDFASGTEIHFTIKKDEPWFVCVMYKKDYDVKATYTGSCFNLLRNLVEEKCKASFAHCE